MKNVRLTLVSLTLGLAAMTAAWGAESVMNLISGGEAVQKEVTDTKAAYDTAVRRDKELGAEGPQLAAANEQLNKDIANFKKESDSVSQRTDDYKARCSPDKHLNSDEFKACTADKDQLNADIGKLGPERDEINKRIADLQAKINAHNEEAKGSGDRVHTAYNAYFASLKKEGAWLDQARTLMVSDAFKPLGAKASCPDVTKNPKKDEDQIKMSNDVVACLKKVSASS